MRRSLPLTQKHAAVFLATLFYLAVGSIPFCGCGQTGDPGSSVSVQQLKSTFTSDKGAILVDVRTAEELSGELGALDGVVHIPLQNIETGYAQLNKMKDKDVYVICRSGNRSRKAADFLLSKGFHAHNVEGGMKAWRAAYGSNNR